MSDLSDKIRTHALALGFDLVGWVPAAPVKHAAFLDNWLRLGYHADMAWMARNLDKRRDPRLLLDGAATVLVAACSYDIASPLEPDASRGYIASYARGPDYHNVMKQRLHDLAACIRQQAGRVVRYRAFVDSAPLLEREWAVRAGLGWQGWNTCLIHPTYGSGLFLGELLLDIVLPDATGPMKPAGDCRECGRCLTACPTGALCAPYTLDSRRCLSYLTIEHKGALPEEQRTKLGNRVFGCDACQRVCPWNKPPRPAPRAPFLSNDSAWTAPDLAALMDLDEVAFKRRFGGTPVARTKRIGLLRNAATALANAPNPSARQALEKALNDPEPLVRKHAAWALR